MPNRADSILSSDVPILHRSDDRLNRAPFAKRIADVIRAQPLGSNLTIGIYSPWGDGKSSMLNLLKEELLSCREVELREFNPWRFKDETRMLEDFFRVLADAAGVALNSKSEKLAKNISKIADYVSPPSLNLGIVQFSGETLRVAQMARDYANRDLEDLLGRVRKSLRDARKKIIVIMDDIDRLDKTEVHTLFRMIKACADFPNVYYILAFDDATIAAILGERLGDGGSEAGLAFLEKIVQVPLRLPLAHAEDLRRMCFLEIERALDVAEIRLSESEMHELFRTFNKSITRRLCTPREVRRYGNSLLFALPMLKGEVNPVDHILIEALRVFFPSVYTRIRREPELLTGHRDRATAPAGTDGEEPAHALLRISLSGLSESHSSCAADLVTALFPNLSRRAFAFPSDLGQLSRERRAASPDYCRRYFGYSVPTGDISDREIADVVEAAEAGNRARTAQLLEAAFEHSKVRRAIEKLQSFEMPKSIAAIKLICTEIAGLAQLIPDPPGFLQSIATPAGRAAGLVASMIQSITGEEEQIAAAEGVLNAADPIWFGALILQEFAMAETSREVGPRRLSDSALARIRARFAQLMDVAAKDGALDLFVEGRNDLILFMEWQRAAGLDRVQQHLVVCFKKEPDSIRRFLQGFTGWSSSLDKPTPRRAPLSVASLESMKNVVDLKVLEEVIESAGFHDSAGNDGPHPAHASDLKSYPSQYLEVYRRKMTGASTKPAV